jgi:uncharacterized protein (DUF305 family)
MAQEQAAVSAAAEPVAAGRQTIGAMPRLILLLVGVVVLGFLIGAAARSFWPGPPGEDSADVGFLRDMSTHHDQAVAMALIIRDRTADVVLKTMATDIVLTQQGQIGAMTAWLQVWDLGMVGEDLPMTWMGHPTSGLMPGMATAEEVQQLRDLPVAEAEVLFLRLMIRHHLSGVDMAEACLDRCDEDVVTRLAGGIAASQRGEIVAMNEMLVARGEEPEAATASTASEHMTEEHANGTPGGG